MSELNKRTFLKFAVGTMAAAIPVHTALAASETDKMPLFKETSADGKSVQYRFVQSAYSVTTKSDELTLHGINPSTLFFSDRPERIAGRSRLPVSAP